MCKVMGNLGKTAVITTAFCLTLPLYAAQFAGGTGEPDNPYQIATAEQLCSIGSDPNLQDKHFVLTADIDLDPDLPGGKLFDRAVIAPDADAATDGYQGTAFSGVFDGDGHTISNLTIQGVGCLGLFGRNSGVVRNVGLVNADVTGSGNAIGALAGSNLGSVAWCCSTGAVVGSSIIGGLVGGNTLGRVMCCYSHAAVDATGNSVGGLVGHNDNGNIAVGYSTGAVSGDSYVGGLVGRNYDGAVMCSYSTGAVRGSMHIGGLIGQNWIGDVTHCYSTGAVTGESTFGGLVGSNLKAGRSPGAIIGCFWDIETSGQTSSGAGTGETTARMQDLATFLAAGWDFIDETANGICSYWQMSTGQYPRLCCYDPDAPVMLEGSGTAEEPYLIRDANDLGAVWLKPAAHYRLETPLDLSPITWSMAVVPWFDGIFDGNGYVISNLRIEGVGTLGLFGESDAAASILNLGLEAVEIDGTGTYIGGLAGINRGSIVGSYSTGTLVGDWYIGGLVGDNEGSITTSYSESTVSADAYTAGGLVGRNSGSITSCHSAGEVTADGHVGGLVGQNYIGGVITVSYSTAAARGTDTYVGGLVGYNSGSVATSHSTGTIDGMGYVGGLTGCNSGTIATSYSTSTVDGEQLVGGLAGFNGGGISTSCSNGIVTGDYRVGGAAGYNDGSITASYSNAAVSGADVVGGLVGYNVGLSFTQYGTSGVITMCYSAGVVSGSASVGGLVAMSTNDVIAASFWDMETSGQIASSGGEGKTTAQMQTVSTFLDAGWDFVDETANGTEDLWSILEGQGYPRLWWESEETEATAND